MSQSEMVRYFVPNLWELVHDCQLRIWFARDGAFIFQQGDIASIAVQFFNSKTYMSFEFKNLWRNGGPGHTWKAVPAVTLELEFEDTWCLLRSKYEAGIRNFEFKQPEAGWIAFISKKDSDRWIEIEPKTQ